MCKSAYVRVYQLLNLKIHGETLKFIVLCILIFKYLDSKLEDKQFCTE